MAMPKLSSNSNFLFLPSFLVFAIAMVANSNNMVAGQGCEGDIQGLISQCAMYVQKSGPIIDPSPGCCNVVKNVDIPCVCQHITKEVAQVIDMKKVTFVAQFCGRPLPPGTKCGSAATPGHV